MGVSLSQYRAARGAFIFTGKSKMGQKLENCQSFSKFLLLICMLLAISVISETHQKRSFYSYQNLSNAFAKYVNGNGKNQGIRLSHFNKGGSFLVNRLNEIENVISKHHPHILGISEANFFKNHDIEDVKIENYNFISAKTLDNPDLNVSRVCVYLHKSIVAKVRTDLMNDTVSSIWIEAGLPNRQKILICNIYREWGHLRQNNYHQSRDINAQMNRWASFVDQWENALEEGKEVVVLGDVNINHIDWTKEDSSASHQTKRLRPLINHLFERILSQGVVQLVSKPTRIAPHQPPSGLDHLYTNEPKKMSPVQVIPNGSSDHSILLATRYAKSIRYNARYISKRCYKHFNKDDFLAAVRSFSFWEIYKCEDANEAASMLTNILNSVLDYMAPVKTIQIREKYSPWLSPTSKYKMAERDVAQKIASQTGLDTDWQHFRRLRNDVNNILRHEKKKWQRSKIEMLETENNSGQLWKNVKKWLNWSSSGAPRQLFYDGKFINKPIELATCMNSFFIQKVAKIKDSLSQSHIDPVAKLSQMMENHSSTFKFKPVHPDEVSKAISQLKNSGSAGLDYIDAFIIKTAKNEIVPAITHIINLSLQQSIFPAIYKTAKVIPLHKSGDQMTPKNYRPVALLPVLSKLLERMVFDQIVNHFESNSLFHPNHHGFRSHHSTTTALLQMYDTWVEALNRGEATGVVLLDLSAAFDMVSPLLLIKKLQLYGFEKSACKWIESYLSHRSQTVCVDGSCSPLLPIDFGLPQGSILGPLMYTIFTNDLPECIHDHRQVTPPHPRYNVDCQECGSICCFADDSSFSFSSKTAADLCEHISEKFKKVSDYMASNELKLNSDKTHLLLLMSDESRQHKPNFIVQLNTGTEIIETTNSEKLLGGIIAQNLKFKEHIVNHNQSMLKSLNIRLNALKKIQNVASFKGRKMVANGIIMSKLVYLAPLWAGCEAYLKKSLQLIQNKAARIVTKCDNQTPIKRLLVQCGWLSVRQLCTYHSLVLFFKIRQSEAPYYMFVKLFSDNNMSYNLRSTADEKVRLGPDSQAQAELARNSFKYRTTKEWNVLPLELRNTPKLDMFKIKLKQWIKENIPIA